MRSCSQAPHGPMAARVSERPRPENRVPPRDSHGRPHEGGRLRPRLLPAVGRTTVGGDDLASQAAWRADTQSGRSPHLRTEGGRESPSSPAARGSAEHTAGRCPQVGRGGFGRCPVLCGSLLQGQPLRPRLLLCLRSLNDHHCGATHTRTHTHTPFTMPSMARGAGRGRFTSSQGRSSVSAAQSQGVWMRPPVCPHSEASLRGVPASRLGPSRNEASCP